MSKMNPQFLCNYTAKSTPIHQLPASIKLLGLFLISLSSYFPKLSILIILFSILSIISIVSQLSISSYLLILKISVFYSIFIIAFRLTGKPVQVHIYLNEINLSLWYISRLVIVLFAGTIFYTTTSATDIRYSLARIFKSQKKKFDISLLFSLTILFIPRIFQTWTSFERAWISRGGNKHSVFNAWRMITVLIPLFLITLLSYANNTDRAVRNRSL